MSPEFLDDEPVLEALMEADVDVTDVECEDGIITVFASANEFNMARTALSTLPDISFVEDISWVPQATTAVSGDDADDVQQVYHNAELPA